MKSTQEIKNSVCSFFKKKKKTTAGAIFVGISVLIQNLTSFVQEEISIIDQSKTAIESHELRIKELENYRSSKDVAIEEMVSRTSFNAYIARQDEEYHIQQQKNDDFTAKIGNLSGRVGELEAVTYELNENAINGGGKYEDGDPN